MEAMSFKNLIEESSTAALEANLNKLPQFTPNQTPSLGADIQPTATNTPGAATVFALSATVWPSWNFQRMPSATFGTVVATVTVA